mmetsp:Transcript_13370/g.40427  ORF Transcript_13370/g.40427 Transcript_13370/m.40427 type:complete len:255 (+) Transcript_13370:470-1234(+)
MKCFHCRVASTPSRSTLSSSRSLPHLCMRSCRCGRAGHNAALGGGITVVCVCIVVCQGHCGEAGERGRRREALRAALGAGGVVQPGRRRCVPQGAPVAQHASPVMRSTSLPRPRRLGGLPRVGAAVGVEGGHRGGGAAGELGGCVPARLRQTAHRAGWHCRQRCPHLHHVAAALPDLHAVAAAPGGAVLHIHLHGLADHNARVRQALRRVPGRQSLHQWLGQHGAGAGGDGGGLSQEARQRRRCGVLARGCLLP